MDAIDGNDPPNPIGFTALLQAIEVVFSCRRLENVTGSNFR